MRVLLDESLPRPLAALLDGHDVQTVAAMRWSGKQNGELLRLAARSFDVLVTAESLAPLVPELLRLLQTLAPRRLVHLRV